jgi:lysozyme family protein
MADFKIAEAQTGRFEGGYANNPADRGGETYAGIARKFWPNWKGWLIIDEIKSKHGKTSSIINKFAKTDQNLHKMISQFYKANFWDVNKLDLFTDQQVANSVYDFGVNAGTKKASKTLQQLFGLLQDGIIGKDTLKAVNNPNPGATLNGYNELRKAYYLKLAQNPTQHQFLKSWLSRLKPYA